MAPGRARGGAAKLDADALVQLALERADDEPYVTLLLLLLARDAGEGAAAVELDTLRTAELVSPEDETLARFQLALLYQRGIEVEASPKLAREHLRAAARSLGAKLPSNLESAVDRVREAIGLPAEIEPTRPLGPATPGRPGWLRRDHATAPPLGPLPRAAPGRRARKVPAAPTEPVHALALSRDGRTLASGGIGGELLLWNVEQKRPERRGPNPGGDVASLSFDATGRYLAIGSEEARWTQILDLEADELLALKGKRAAAAAVAFHSHERRLYSGDFDGGIREWELGKTRPARSIQIDDSVWSLVVSPDGTHLFAGLDKDVVRIDLRSWEIDQTFSVHSHLVHGLSLSPDGILLLSASRDAMVGVLDSRTGDLLHVLADHTAGVYGAVFTPSGRVVSGGLDGRVLVYDLSAGTHDKISHTKPIHGVVAHGRTVAVGGDDGVLLLELD